MTTASNIRLWVGALALAALISGSGGEGVYAAQVEGQSGIAQTGAQQGPHMCHGTQCVWREGNTDVGSGGLIKYENSNPPDSRILASGQWYLDPQIENGRVVWLETNAPCPGAGEGEICTPRNAKWNLVAYGITTGSQKQIAEGLAVTTTLRLSNGVVTWQGPSNEFGGPMATWQYDLKTFPPVPTLVTSTTPTPTPVPPAGTPTTTPNVPLPPATIPVFIDTDDEGLSDTNERVLFKTNPLNVDTDGDGLDDYHEAYLYRTDATRWDTDGDGFSDGTEVAQSTNPTQSGRAFFSSDWYEWTALPRTNKTSTPLPPANVVSGDTDGDGLTDADERTLFHTNTLRIDTDGDSLTDYRELFLYRTNPSASDSDRDGRSDAFEILHDTNPNQSGFEFFNKAWYEWSATAR